MCDYSLHHVASRRAKVGDKLVTMELSKSSTRGFAAVGEHDGHAGAGRAARRVSLLVAVVDDRDVADPDAGDVGDRVVRAGFQGAKEDPELARPWPAAGVSAADHVAGPPARARNSSATSVIRAKR